MATPDGTWSETAFVTITKKGGSDIEYMTLTETVDLKVGDKDIDVINTLAGGRLVAFKPQDVTELTLEAYPLEVSTTTGAVGKGFADIFNTTADTTYPISITNDRTRPNVRVCVLWTSDTTVTKATAITTGTYAGFRMTFINGYVTSYVESFTDGVKKATIKIKVPAFNVSGTGNITWEATDGTAVLPAVAAYT